MTEVKPGPIDAYFANAAYLPVQPSLRNKLRAVLDSNASQEVRRAALEEAAQAFPVFAYNLLKLINSPVFNLKTKILVIKQAVTLPTFDKLAEMLKAMPDYPAETEKIFSMARFEEHGRAAALTVQLLSQLSRKFSTLDRERYYTAALIHDIGRLFLVLGDPAGYSRLMREKTPGTQFIEIERGYFGTDHAMLSALAIEKMGVVDKEIVAAVRQHHEVPSGNAVVLAYADRIIKRFGIGLGLTTEMWQAMSSDNYDDLKLKVAVEETLHQTVGEVLMHVLSEVDTLLTSGLAQFKTLVGTVE